MATRQSRDGVHQSAVVREGVAVIGLGNWGSSLAVALRKARMPALELVHATSDASGKPRRHGTVPINAALLDSHVLWLAVPDGAIGLVASQLVAKQHGSLHGQIVVHSSGALSSAVLDEAAAAGAAIASVHPLMSFPSHTPIPLANVPFGVEASDARTRRVLFTLVRRLGGRPFALSAEGKALYHAASTFASPLLASLLAVALQTMEAAGLGQQASIDLLGPIARRTVENVFRSGPERSFSGPIARGDASTVELHVHALQELPSAQEVYRSLALASLSLLPSANARAIRTLLEAGFGSGSNVGPGSQKREPERP